MDEYFEATVLSIEDVCPDRLSSPVEQYASVRLSNGQELTLFDPDFHIKKEMYGKKVKLSAFIFFGPTKDVTVDIVSPLKCITLDKYRHVIPVGKILKLSKTREGNLDGIIDVGAAKFTFWLMARFSYLKEGDFIRIYITSSDPEKGELGTTLQLNDAKLA